MAVHIRKVDYFYVTVKDEPGEAHKVLAQLAELGVDLLAMTMVPVGAAHTQLTIFPEDVGKLQNAAGRTGMALGGPQSALLVQGDDKLGALVEIHAKLSAAAVNVYASNAVADGFGKYGYVIYVRPEDFDRAADALGV